MFSGEFLTHPSLEEENGIHQRIYLVFTTHATGSPEVMLMGKGKMKRKSGAGEISSRMSHLTPPPDWLPPEKYFLMFPKIVSP